MDIWWAWAVSQAGLGWLVNGMRSCGGRMSRLARWASSVVVREEIVLGWWMSMVVVVVVVVVVCRGVFFFFFLFLFGGLMFTLWISEQEDPDGSGR